LAEHSHLPWHAMSIVAVTVVILIGLRLLVVFVVDAVTRIRDALRGRYTGARWSPALVDLAGVPLWIVVELTCLVARLLFALVVLFIAYQALRRARDWWHAAK